MDTAKVSKAIAGALVTILVAILAKYSILLTPEQEGAVSLLVDMVLAGGIGYLGVYLAPKNKE